MKNKKDNQSSSIGLHVDGYRIRGVLLHCGQSCFEIIRVASVAFKGGMGDADSIDAMRAVLDRLDPSPKCSIYMTTAFEQFFTTHLSIVDAPLAQMNKIAGMAFRQEMNIGTQDHIFDYERVGGQSAAAIPKVSLHAFSVEASRKMAVCAALEAAGHQTAALFPELFALRNLVAVSEPAAPVALLFLDRNELRIAVVHNKKYVFIRTFKSGWDAFLEHISKMVDQKITFSALEKALDSDSNDYETQLPLEIRAAFSFVADRMQKQIERAFKFYESHLKLDPMQQIFLHSDSRVLASSLASYLEQNYRDPVILLNVDAIESIFIPHSLCSPNEMEEYTLATGAALAGVQLCPNLLYTHDDQEQRCKGHRIKTAWVLTLSALALICFGAFGVQLARLTPRMLKYRSLERQVSTHATQYTKEFMQAKSLLSQRRLIDLHAVSKRYCLQGCFFELCRLLPPELKLEQFHVELNGAAANNDTSGVVGRMSLQGLVVEQGLRQQALLTKFLVEVGNSPLFQNISRDPVSPKEIEAYTELGALPFRMSCDTLYGGALSLKKKGAGQ